MVVVNSRSDSVDCSRFDCHTAQNCNIMAEAFVLALMLIGNSFAVAAAASGGDPSRLHLDMCITPALYAEAKDGSLSLQRRTMAVTEVVAALRAVRDVNTRNCSIIKDCEELVALPGKLQVAVLPCHHPPNMQAKLYIYAI